MDTLGTDVGVAEGPDRSPASPRTTAADAFAAAQRRYLAGERIDMQALATELGVSRPTLYRWTGGRERLISDVLFRLADAEFAHASAETAHLRGATRLIAHFRLYVGRLVVGSPLQAFLRQESQLALRILTARDSSLQARTVERLRELYQQEQASGAFDPGVVDLDTLAYAVVKITQAFIYNDALLAVEPEVEHATEIVSLLLGGGR